MLIDAIAVRLTQKLVDKDIIHFDDWDVYLFGLQLMISGILKTLGFMIIAWGLGCIPETLVFLAAFALLRIYAGGYHSSSYLKCFFTTVILAYGSIYIFRLGLLQPSIINIVIMLAAASAMVIIYAPVDSENRRLSEGEHSLNRSKSVAAFVVSAIFILIVSITYPEFTMFSSIAAAAIFLESLTLAPIFAHGQIK